MAALRNIVLVKPPERSSFNFGAFSLAVLAGAVRDLGEVHIEDATSLDLHTAVAAALARQPDLIGITTMGMESLKPVARLIQHLRAARPEQAIVCGGHGATCAPAALLESGADAVVIGEGEVTFRGIVKNGIQPGAPGAIWRANGSIVSGALQKLVDPLDQLPIPGRDLMPVPPDGVHLMETSRGCPHSCGFCETTRFHQRLWRPFSPQRIAKEVARLVDDFNAWVIHFADDSFAANADHVLEICQALKKGPLPVFFMASARADDLIRDPRLLPAMAKARILRVSVGVETLDSKIGANIGKPISFNTYRTAFRLMRGLGMFSVASLIVGLPGESPAGRAQAVEMIIEAGPDSAHFVPFQPLPGVPLASRSEEIRSEDIRDARAFTVAFFRHPRVRTRLKAAVRRGGTAGMLASGTLQKHRK
jgi:anaerobic magnesium-protoporphyrin IX monomethyl ester cyclase